MPVSAELLAILACPSGDHAPLQVRAGTQDDEELVCTVCASRFPVRDGIPVLLADEAVPGPNGLGVPATDPGEAQTDSAG
jgi:uncharacterized protein YbaR (Trm112 family)